MQGIIASVLALMMTGMVIGQQPQNNFNDRQPSRVKLLDQYLLPFTAANFRTLKQFGYLPAKLQRGEIDHIVFAVSGIDTESPDFEPASIQPVPPVDGDRELVFLMDDQDLDFIQRKGLRYILRSADIGRFNSLKIKYESPAGRWEPQSIATQPIRQRPRQVAADQFVNQRDPRLNRPTAMSDSNDFYGPNLPEEFLLPTQQNQAISQNNRQISNDTSGSFRPNLGTVASRRRDSINQNPNQQDVYQNDYMRGSLDAPARSNDQFEYDDRRFVRQNRAVPDERMAFNNPFDSTPFRTDPPMVQVDPRQAQRSTPDYDPVLKKELELSNAENRSLDRMNQNLTDEIEALRRRLQDEKLANRLNRVELEQRQDPRAAAYADEYDYPRSSRLPERRRESQVVVQPPINTIDTMYERVAVAPRPSNRLELEIAGPNSKQTSKQANPTQEAATSTPAQRTALVGDAERYRKQNQALWFIMLCSLGLNFYLSWIARGFYVRYEELADDIRETFTSSL